MLGYLDRWRNNNNNNTIVVTVYLKLNIIYHSINYNVSKMTDALYDLNYIILYNMLSYHRIWIHGVPM